MVMESEDIILAQSCSKSLCVFRQSTGQVRQAVGKQLAMAAFQINVGLCLHRWSDFHMGISRGIAAYLQDNDRWNLCVTMPPEGGLRASLADWDGEGLICSVESREDAAFVKSLNIPVVNVTGKWVDPDIASVIGDDDLIGKMAAGHFFDRGFENFACFGMTEVHFALKREKSFGEEVRARGGHLAARFEARTIFPLPWKERLRQLELWLADLPKPLAMFTVFDTLAHLAIASCHSAGFAVPDEVAVLGVDNDPSIYQLSNPPLSSVGLALERRGFYAAQLLDRLLAGEPMPTAPVCIPPNGIFARRSTDVYAVADPALRTALQFIASETPSNLRVEDVASAAGISRRNLERKMRQTLGCTVYEEIRRRRLLLAKNKLRTGKRSLTGIALDSGFNSSSDFSKIFRKFEGMTPSDYRNRFGEILPDIE
jgi:LacI family transcriptional regulator